MVCHIIVVGVSIASRKIDESNRQWLVGNLLATRKKPHAIDVALEQNTQHSC
jgi:hypothetical protein